MPRITARTRCGEAEALLERRLDRDVEAAFAGTRSLGIVAAVVERVYVRRSTGGRRFVRVAFSDAARQQYDWIVPELRFRRVVEPHVSGDELSADAAERLRCALRAGRTYLCIALTKPNDRFPGRFGGCHPLVVGVHSFGAGAGWDGAPELAP
jgi:hypothetical protein